MYVRRIIFLVLLSTPVCRNALADEFIQLGSWDAILETLVDVSRTEIDSNGGTGGPVEFETIRPEGRFTIRSSQAFLIDPRLLTFNLGGTFGLGREEYTSVVRGVTSRENRDVDLSGYNFFTTILPRNSTLSAELFANRNQNTQTRELSGRTDIDVENLGATLRAKRLYLPSTLSIRRERSARATRSAASEAMIDERRDVVRYEGLRGWVNKELALRYEMVDKTDPFRPQIDYRDHNATLATSVDFGPDLNRFWDSGIRFNSRDGFSAQDRLEIDESLRFKHNPNLSTSYRYRLYDIERTGGETKYQMATTALTHQLYESLTTDASLTAIDQSFDDGQRDVYEGLLTLRYTKSLPAGGRLNASFSARRQREDDDFDEAFVPQEQHAFDDAFATPVFLANPNVDELSIEVTKIANGPLVPGCAEFSTPDLLVEGVDYQVRRVGNRVEIVPQPCTANSPGINPGDTIAVDYRFTRGGAPIVFNTKTDQLTASVDYGWIRPFFSLERSDQDLVTGIDPGFLTDRRITAIGVELKGQWSRLNGSLRVEAEKFDSDDQVFDNDRATAQLRYTLTPLLWLSMNGSLSSVQYSFPEVRETDLTLLRAELSYGRNGSFSGSLYATMQELEDSRLANERKTGFGLRARWVIGKLTVSGNVSILETERDHRRSSDTRAMLKVQRRFSWR